MIVLVDPVSTGTVLSRAFIECGEEPLHLYGLPLGERYASDSHSRTLLCRNVPDALDRLAGLPITAVVAGSEWGVTTANLLSHALGLPHHVDSLMLARRDKAAMNAALRDAGLPSAHTVKVQGGDDIDSALEEFTLPVIVKPVDSAGGDGCVVCWQASDVAAAVEAALGQRNLLGIKNSEMLIQDYLDGQQFIVNTVSIGGRHLVSDVHTVRVDRVGGRSVMRHSLLVTEMDASATLMVQFTLRCLDAVGIREGAAHTEVRLTAEGPRLIEVNARIMGASLEPSLYRTALGYTQADLVAERFTNPDAFVARFDSPYAPHAAMAMAFLYVSEPGTVVSSPGLDLVRTLPGLHSMEKLPAIGATIAQPWMCTGQAGMAYFVHRQRDLVAASLDRLHRLEDDGQLHRMWPPTAHPGHPSRRAG